MDHGGALRPHAADRGAGGEGRRRTARTYEAATPATLTVVVPPLTEMLALLSALVASVNTMGAVPDVYRRCIT